MPVLITNCQNKKRVVIKRLRQLAQTALEALDAPEAELSLALVDDDEISRLNREYLGRDGPTNVLAFPMTEGPFSEVNPALLGDVIVSVETAAREAAQARTSLEKRLHELIIHGILHLHGYDHATEQETAEMETQAARILERAAV